MSTENQTLEERKNPLLHAGLSSTLKPQTPNAVRLALSNRQNYAMAAEEIFCHALNRTVWIYREHYQAVDVFLGRVRNVSMESVATESGISQISNMVFTENEGAMREFLFTLRVQFFSQFAEFNDPWKLLLQDVAQSLTNESSIEGANTELNLVPEELRVRTYTTQYMYDILLANSWLVMFILIALWGRTFTYDELRANYRRSNAVSAT
jgi:hypothetical protein